MSSSSSPPCFFSRIGDGVSVYRKPRVARNGAANALLLEFEAAALHLNFFDSTCR